MEPKPTCDECGTPLAGGLCPRCLLDVGQATKFSDSQPCALPATQLATPGPHPACGHPLPSDGRGAGGEGTRSFGDYELLEEIARGGMGIVYKARQKNLNRLVAVKMILAGQFAGKQAAQRFRGEAAAAGVLQHPHIVAIHEIGMHEGQHFFSMDYVEGQNLAQLVGNRPLLPKQAARYLKEIADAIHYAHQQGILHRDLKPSNVLIDAASDQPRVTDFGLAKRLDGESSITVTGQVLGSPNFMPPEQASGARGKVGRPSDVYGLGGILYFLLTARAPFQGQTIEATIHQTIHNEPIAPRLLNASVPRDLETICLKCLEKEPTKRYASAQELADELNRFLNDEPIHARPVTRVERAWRWCRRKPALAAAYGFIVLLALVITVGSPIAALRIERERQRADTEATEARRGIYTADVSRAQEALTQNDVGRARKLLSRHVPKPRTVDLRGWEWRYLWKQCQSDELGMLGVMSNAIPLVRYSSNGRRLVTGDHDGHLMLWDMVRRQPIGQTSDVFFTERAVNFSQDSTLLGLVDFDGAYNRVRLWDATAFQERPPLLRTTNRIDWLAFSSDGPRLFTASAGELVTWNIADSKAIERQTLPPGRATAAYQSKQDFNSERQVLVIVQEGNLLIWDTKKRSVRTSIPGLWDPGSYNPTTFCFSPDGRTLAVGQREGFVSIWNAFDGRFITNLVGHVVWTKEMSFTPDGRRLITSGFDQTLRIWDTSAWVELSVLRGHEDEIWAMSIAPDGRTVITGAKDATLREWSALPKTAGSDTIEFPQSVMDLAPTPDGHYFAAISKEQVQIIDSRTFQEMRRLGIPLTNRGPFAVSPGARWIANGTESGAVTLIEMETGEQKMFNSKNATSISLLQFSPDGKWLATTSPDSVIGVWEISKGQLVREFKVSDEWPQCLLFSPDSSLLFTTHSSRRNRLSALWRIPTGEKVTNLVGHLQDVTGAAFSWDGKQIATTSRDGTARVWDVATGSQIALLRAQLTSVFSAAFSPDGSRLATGTGNGPAKLYEIAHEQELIGLGDVGSHASSGGTGENSIFFLDDITLVAAKDRRITRWTAALLNLAPATPPAVPGSLDRTAAK